MDAFAPSWQDFLNPIPSNAHPQRTRLFVHCNYLAARLSRSSPNHSIVYCPRTHAAFGHPPHPFREFLARGVRVCLATDSLASNPDLDILAEARFVPLALSRLPRRSAVEDGHARRRGGARLGGRVRQSGSGQVGGPGRGAAAGPRRGRPARIVVGRRWGRTADDVPRRSGGRLNPDPTCRRLRMCSGARAGRAFRPASRPGPERGNAQPHRDEHGRARQRKVIERSARRGSNRPAAAARPGCGTGRPPRPRENPANIPWRMPAPVPAAKTPPHSEMQRRELPGDVVGLAEALHPQEAARVLLKGRPQWIGERGADDDDRHSGEDRGPTTSAAAVPRPDLTQLQRTELASRWERDFEDRRGGAQTREPIVPATSPSERQHGRLEIEHQGFRRRTGEQFEPEE